jgi:hypothetical protein
MTDMNPCCPLSPDTFQEAFWPSKRLILVKNGSKRKKTASEWQKRLYPMDDRQVNFSVWLLPSF